MVKVVTLYVNSEYILKNRCVRRGESVLRVDARVVEPKNSALRLVSSWVLRLALRSQLSLRIVFSRRVMASNEELNFMQVVRL